MCPFIHLSFTPVSSSLRILRLKICYVDVSDFNMNNNSIHPIFKEYVAVEARPILSKKGGFLEKVLKIAVHSQGRVIKGTCLLDLFNLIIRA